MKGLLDNMFDFDHDGKLGFLKEQQRDSLLIT